jgi:predicted 3-demethylubiquinone-9 3-methyltransferase (glyoxalase superfamily)
MSPAPVSGPKITTCLWFDGQAEAAAEHYISIFPDSKITSVNRFTPPGATEARVMVVNFTLSGHPFMGLNGGPNFKIDEAVSFMVSCKDQEEVDYYWDKLGEGGDEDKRRCAWTADKFGVSWQIVPVQMMEIMSGPDKEGVKRAYAAMMGMKKIEIEGLRNAYEGK